MTTRSGAVPPFAAAIFDMDGLLIDSERPIRDAFIAACVRQRIEFGLDVYARVIGRNRIDSARILREQIGDDVRYETIVAETMVAIEAIKRAGGFALKPGARALLDALAVRGVSLAVASSSQRLHVEERLRAVGVLDRFHAFCGGDEVERGKPHPDLFLLAAHRLEHPTQHCIVFEDSCAGATAAIGAGMAVVVVPDLQLPDERIARDSFAVMPSLEAVQDRLAAWFLSTE